LPELPDAAYVTVAPDWVCEILSPSTESVDRADKLPVYAREGVRHVWFVDPEVRTLEVLRLDGESYRIVEVRRGDETVAAEPFDALELPLGVLWER
jgi:Uma2 family endonuclease